MADDLPKVGAEAVLITDKYTRDIADVIKLADKADQALNSIEGTVDVKVKIDDSKISTATKLVNNIDAAAPSVKINADDSELDDVGEKIDTLIGMQAIDLAIGVPGKAIEFVESLGRFSGIGGVVEIDNALASIEGRTGRMIPEAEHLITDLYTNGWGESRQQIADTVVEAANLKIANEDLAEATLSAFQVQSVMGGDTNEILRTMDSLVKNDLAPDFTTAADLIVTGLQNGADRGQDLLDTFNEYGTTFGQLRISGPGALALINSGLDAGIDNSDRIADAIRETGIRLAEMGTDPNIKAAFTQLDALSDVDLAGLLDAYEAGQISGDEFFQGFFQAFSDAEAVDPGKASNLATTLIGTQSEDFKIGAISQLTTEWDTAMGELEGRAETAGNEISDTLGTSVETLLRSLEQASVDFLSSEQIDLPGKIEAIKEGIQEALGILAEGGTVGEAIEIGLNLPGFNDGVNLFASSIGNFAISVLELIAGVQDFTGHGDAAAATRQQIARLAEGQLAFDLKVANEDDIGNAVKTALDRGVDASKVSDLANVAVEELISQGEVDKAQALADELERASAVITLSRGGRTQTVTTSQGVDETLEQFQARLEAAKAEAERGGTQFTINMLPEIDTDALQTQIDTAKEAIARSMMDFGPDLPKVNPLGAFGAEQGAMTSPFMQMPDFGGGQEGGMFGAAIKAFDDVVAKSDETAANVATDWDDLNISMDNSVGQTITKIDEAAAKVEEMDTRTATALTGNTVTASFDAVRASAEASFPPAINLIARTAGETEHLDLAAQAASISLAGLMAGVKNFPIAKLEQIAALATTFAGAQNIVNNSSTTNNVNVTNNNSNGAQTSNSQYELSQQLGGG